ncbi:hypothetical protein KP509_1Z139400 [Ceratopteris richardii]|nr:hypothetical protein KP509_1Z139400 [Ceratopteris richardii]
MCMKCQFLYPIQQQTSTMALNGSFYGRKQITGAMNPHPRSYFKCAVHGCHVPLHLSSLRIHHHLLDSSRLKKMCMKCQFLYPIQQQTSTMALNGSFYGRKQITGAMNPNPRSYFKCAVHGCHAKKWTQSSSQMPGSIYLSHSGRHSHSLRSSNQLDSQDAHNLLWP